MNWHNVELFVEVMGSLSFTEVANRRVVAPSSVSRAIAALEAELGVKLFQRNPRQITPTEAAEVFFQKVAPLVSGFDEARSAVRDAVGEPKGVLRVSAPVVYAQMHLVPLLARFSAQFPQVEVELIQLDRFVDLLAERIDVAIRHGALSDSGYVATKLHAMPFVLCAAPEYLLEHGQPDTPQDLVNHDCLIFLREGGPSAWRFRDDAGAVADVSVTGRYRFNHSDTVRQCALTGMGIALLPSWLVADDVAQGRLVALLPQYQKSANRFDSAAWLLQPSRGFQPLKSRVFMDFCLEHLAKM